MEKEEEGGKLVMPDTTITRDLSTSSRQRSSSFSPTAAAYSGRSLSPTTASSSTATAAVPVFDYGHGNVSHIEQFTASQQLQSMRSPMASRDFQARSQLQTGTTTTPPPCRRPSGQKDGTYFKIYEDPVPLQRPSFPSRFVSVDAVMGTAMNMNMDMDRYSNTVMRNRNIGHDHGTIYNDNSNEGNSGFDLRDLHQWSTAFQTSVMDEEEDNTDDDDKENIRNYYSHSDEGSSPENEVRDSFIFNNDHDLQLNDEAVTETETEIDRVDSEFAIGHGSIANSRIGSGDSYSREQLLLAQSSSQTAAVSRYQRQPLANVTAL